MKPKISLCMIAKNEATFIGQCLKSALPYIDQIIVVDTGSTDKTKDIARNLGAEVYDFKWQNDFSSARNYSLEKAWGDWILFMDCDEEIDEKTTLELFNAVNSTEYDAYYIKVKNLLACNQEVSFYSIRLFRNLPCFRFEGKIHEQISFSIAKNSGLQRIGKIDFCILHHGYNPEKVNIKAKINRNIKLLQEEKKSNQNKGFLLYNLGIELLRQGKFQKALEYFIESLKYTNNNAGYAPSLINKTIVCLIELNRCHDALEQIKNFLRIYPDYSDLYLLEAACHLKCGRYTLAKNNIKKAINITSNDVKYPIEGHIFGQKPEKISEFLENKIINNKKFKLSICLLASNDETTIGKCLQSIAEIADEINLITTSENTDNTLNIAYQMGARIFRLKWENNYAKIRNFALNICQGDWILILHGSEEIDTNEIHQIVECLNHNCSKTGFYLKKRTFFDKNNFFLYQDEPVLRIIKNDKLFYYQSSFLEDIEQSILNNYSNAKLGYLPVTIRNYESVLKPLNFTQNLTLIANDIKIFGEKSIYREALGLEFMKYNKYRLASLNFDKARKLTNKVSAQLFFKSINCELKLKNYTKALNLSVEALKIYPDYTDILYLQGCCYLKLAELDKAYKVFKRCIETGPASWQKYIVQPGVDSFLVHCKIAEIYLIQNNVNQSIKHYLKASKFESGILFSIPFLTEILIKNYRLEEVINFFEENYIDTVKHFCIAAKALCLKGLVRESLFFYEKALQRFKETKNMNLYSIISDVMFDILGYVQKTKAFV